MKLSIIVAIFAIIVNINATPLPDDGTVSVVQDTLGNYKLKINVDGLTRNEQANADGSISGSYSYIDPNGVTRNIKYTSGIDGFNVISDDLPVAPLPVQDTPEVAQAKLLHSTLLE